MSAIPSVRRMVMFKHGVAYLERGGPADGPFELSFKKDEMNDILKSLAVWVARGEARVGAVAFEKPEDPEQALQERKLDLAPGAALSGLAASFRGRRVAIEAGGVRHEGEILGVEAESAGDEGDRKVLLLKTGEGQVALVDLALARSIDFLDGSSKADLAFLVDRSRAATAGTSRTVRVAIAGKADDLRVSYVIPAPAWRVSYRVARDEGRTVLMAWGIVHNPADEDLEDLELTLTTGQPVSFMIDLYNPKNVRRAVVEESSRAAAAPTQYERAPMRAGAGGRAAPGTPPPPAARMAFAAPIPRAPQALMEAAAYAPMGGAAAQMGGAEYAERGELFEYKVASRVSLKRGGSAMVPLLGTPIAARKERIWRLGSPPPPDLVLTFKNETGAVLEEGAAVVYDQSVYAGEAMVPYSARGVDVRLAFAKDLGVRCKHTSETRTVTSGIRLARDAAVEEQRGEEHHELTAESDHPEEIEVVFELPKYPGRSLDPDHAQPSEDTMSFRRFSTKVPPRGRATLKVVERWHHAQRYQYAAVSPQHLHHWLDSRFLDRRAFDELSAVLGAWERARELERQLERVTSEQAEAYEKQKRLSEQLGVLKDGGKEGELRLRYVRELEVEQDAVNRLGAEMRRLRDAIEASKKEGFDRLRTLTG